VHSLAFLVGALLASPRGDERSRIAGFEGLSPRDDAGLRCRLRSALTHPQVRSLAVLVGALPAPRGDERSRIAESEGLWPRDDAGRRCRLRSALAHPQVRSLA